MNLHKFIPKTSLFKVRKRARNNIGFHQIDQAAVFKQQKCGALYSSYGHTTSQWSLSLATFPLRECNFVFFVGIAMEAINYARHARIDVVLVDTAGRMQDNEPLMRALAKLISGTTSTCYKTTTLWCHLEDTVY